MPKNKKINKVMLIGSGPIIISQGCEFDYSGTQACKALKEEGYTVILVNPNPATIMTDPDLADVTYIEPLTPFIIEKIIQREKPDAILPTMGGQTALNLTLELQKLGILAKYNVRLIGVTLDTIQKAEDRNLFNKILKQANLPFPLSVTISSLEESKEKQIPFGFPRIIRTSYTLGGNGSGVVHNEVEMINLLEQIYETQLNNVVLIEESLEGWKEFELEVMADAAGNFIVVCPIENLDPMGVHTGDSITIAPCQTLTDKEYQCMRNMAKKLMKEIGMISGGCNVQFAINPIDGRMVIIEINPRVSRSSALASKATGFPIAKVATKIAIGYTLNELANDITGSIIPASFEPSIDYVVVKIPRFNFDKFPNVDKLLTTRMKSIGEVMGIGKTFVEALQKAIRGLETNAFGLISISKFAGHIDISENAIRQMLESPNEFRLFYIMEAFIAGWSISQVHNATKIDPWFLEQIRKIAEIQHSLMCFNNVSLSKKQLLFLKKKGFSDLQISKLTKLNEEEIYQQRTSFNIQPSYKRIDSCAGEFPTETSYMYACYEDVCEAKPTSKEKVLILGSGPNRIGQGVEFDYSCVHAASAVQEMGYEAIMINCNPETVSTDYDCCNRLYFEPLCYENIRDIVLLEKPISILCQFGGQTSLNQVYELHKNGHPVAGTPWASIRTAEDRIEFKNLLDRLKIMQPRNEIIYNYEGALNFINLVGFPIILRSSFVIGGKGFVKIENLRDLRDILQNYDFTKQGVLIEQFICNAKEIDVDAISDGQNVIICGIMEQVEEAGIHSGDSISMFPTNSLDSRCIERIDAITHNLSKELNIIGFLNLQIIIKEDNLYVLELNPRASRTIPFLCKSTGYPFVNIAAKVMLGRSLKYQGCPTSIIPKHIAIKVPVFSFEKLPGEKPKLGIEMLSTGEVMAIGNTMQEALDKVTIYTQKPTKHINMNNIEVHPIQNNFPIDRICYSKML